MYTHGIGNVFNVVSWHAYHRAKEMPNSPQHSLRLRHTHHQFTRQSCRLPDPVLLIFFQMIITHCNVGWS